MVFLWFSHGFPMDSPSHHPAQPPSFWSKVSTRRSMLRCMPRTRKNSKTWMNWVRNSRCWMMLSGYFGGLYGILWDEWLYGWLDGTILPGFVGICWFYGWLQSKSEEDSRTNHFFMAWDKGYLIQTGLLTMGELQCVFFPYSDLCRSSAPSL